MPQQAATDPAQNRATFDRHNAHAKLNTVKQTKSCS